MFFIRALEKIVNDPEVKRSQYAQLKHACDIVLQEIKAAQLKNTKLADARKLLEDEENENDESHSAQSIVGNSVSSPLIGTNWIAKFDEAIDSEKYFTPLELACQCDSARIVVTALDCLQKLLAYGQLVGNYEDSVYPNRKLIDRIVETICRCFTGSDTDDGVQLQIIKALLTVVTSQYVEIHEGTLLLALRTCYNIYLCTKNQVNQTTSRAMMTQMINVIFTKMESELSSTTEKSDYNSVLEHVNDVSKLLESQAAILERNSSEKIHQRSEQEQSQRSDNINEQSVDPEEKEADGSGNNETFGGNTEENTSPSVDSNRNSISKEEITPNPSKNSPEFIHILQKDAFLVFWALCKLSIKTTPEENVVEPKSSESRSKVLSLQLLKTIIETSGTVFKSNSIFITAIKQYLCDSLVINGTSTVSEVFQVVMDIYTILLLEFRKYLTKELEIFFENIFFPVLNLIDIPPEHRNIGFKLLGKICDDVTCLEYLYKNFDCDKSASNIFDRIVIYICSISYGGDKLSGNKIEDDKKIYQSLETTVRVLISMQKWTLQNCEVIDAQISPQKSLKRSDSKTPELTLKILEKADFKNKEFVSCLISLVDTFRLPNDAQQLDAILMQLAFRFCESNPSNKTIECADVAYSLSYAVLELADGFLSSNNAHKLSKEEFLKASCALNNCPSLSQEFLLQVYELVSEHFTSSTRRSSREYESFNLYKGPSISNKQCLVARKMFKIVSMRFLNVLSSGLRESEDTKITDFCFDGMRYGIHLACFFNMKHERDTYVQLLSRFTHVAIKEVKASRLNTRVTIKKTKTHTTTANGVTTAVVTTTTEMKSKSIDAIQAILNVALNEGSNLGSSWLDVLKCVSQIETTRLLETTDNDKATTVEVSERSKSPSGWSSWADSIVGTIGMLDPRQYGTNNQMDPSAKKSIATSVEAIFTNSTQLTGKGVVDFIKGLCHVSLNELATPEKPKMYGLHKLIRVANANMGRIPLQLSKLWQVLGDHLVHLGCSSDEDVSTLAIDSLFEMASILLRREEMANFHFQEFFLWPLEEILKNTQSQSKQTLVVGCIFKIVEAHSSRLRSGWKIVFNIFQHLLLCSDNNVIKEAFQAVVKVVELYEKDLATMLYSVQDTIHCLAEFTCKTESEEISAEALKLIGRCSKLLLLSLERTPTLKDNNVIWLRGWLPIFTEFSVIKSYCMVHETKSELRGRAITEMFRIIKSDGVAFEDSWWNDLFRIIFQIFDSLKSAETEKSGVMKNSTMNDFNCYYCYYYVQFAIVDVISQYFNILGDAEMENFLNNIKWSFSQDDKQLARSGIYCFQELIAHNGAKFTEHNWTVICNFMKSIVETTNCDLNMVHVTAGNQGSFINEMDTKCIVQCELIKMLNKIILAEVEVHTDGQTTNLNGNGKSTDKQLYLKISVKNLFCVLECLEEMFKFSRQSGFVIEQMLIQEQSLEAATLENSFIIEEAQSIQTQIKFLARMYNDDNHQESAKEIEDRLIEACVTAIDNFSSKQSYAHRSDWTEVICFCLTNILELPEEKFKVHATFYYPYLCEIVSLDLDVKLGSILRECLVRIGNLFGVFEYMNEDLKVST